MSYVTLQQLIDKPGVQELSQVASTAHQALVNPDLLQATLLDEDRSAWSSDEQALADQARARIEEIQTEVDQTIDAHIRRRVATVPVLPVPSVLTRIARAFVRYELHKDLQADDKHPVVRDYKDKLKLLEAIRDGKVTLGVDDPLAQSESGLGEVRFESTPPVFGRTNGVR